MKLKNYKLELAHRIESTSGATFVGKKDTLLVARVSGEGQYELELLQLKGFQSILRKPVEGTVATVARAGDNWAMLMLRGEGRQRIFELRTLKDLKPAGRIVEERPGYAEAHPDGSPVAVSHDFGGLNVWDAKTGKQTASYDAKGIGGIAWSQDGALLAAKEMTGSLKIFDSANIGKKPLRSVKLGGDPAIAFHPSETIIAAAEKTAIHIVDAATGKEQTAIARTKESGGTIHRITFSPDGGLLVTSSLQPYVAALWDVKKNEFLGKIRDFEVAIAAVDFDATGKYLLVASFADTEIYSVA